MLYREQKLRLTVFLVVSVLLLAAISSLFIIPKLKDQGEVYYIDFLEMSVNGVNQGADVKYQGVKIGKVVTIDVDPNDLRSVIIGIRVKKDFPVKKDMRATLQYAGITGLRFVEISGGRSDAESLPPGGRILPKKGLGEKAEDIVLNVDSVVEAFNDLLKKENRETIALLLKNLEKSTAVIATTLEKRETSLENTFKNIEQTTRRLELISENLNKFTIFLNDVSGKIPPEKIGNIINNTDAMMGNISKRVSDQELGKVLKDLDTFVQTTTTSVRKLESQFFDLESELSLTLVSLRESMDNISRFTRELTEDPTALIRKRPAKRRKK